MKAGSALQGIVVAELGARIGAGVCGSILGQLGATVVVPERAETSDGKSRHRVQLMAGKLSLATGSEDDESERVAGLIGRSDVVLTSSDLDPAAFASSRWQPDPSRIVCDVTAFGDGGPLAGLPFTDAQIQALSGILDTTGLADAPPTPIRLPIVEFMTGVYAAAACLAALRARKKGADGQVVDMALYDCAFAAMSTFLPRLLDGSGATVRRVGNRHAMAAPWNVYRAQDGWILVCAASDTQWRRICDVVDRRDLAEDPRYLRVADRVARFGEVDAVMQAWVGLNTIARSLDVLGAAGIPCGPVTKVEGFPREANLDHRGMIRSLVDPVSGDRVFVPASPLRMGATGGSWPTRLPARGADHDEVARLVAQTPPRAASGAVAGGGELPLSGLRVIEIGHYTTAPLSARHLANLGADVIKIEPLGGEAVRNWAPAKKGTGYFFTYTNADKRSMALDLESTDGIETLRDLIARSDILIENLKPGALAKRGCSAQEIARLNPRLIYCAVSGFGADSIYPGRPAFDSVIQAMSGIMDLTRAGEVPVKSGISSADLMGAAMAVVAILAALEVRDRTGSGQAIDLSMQDVAAWLTMPLWNDTDAAPQPVLLEAADGFVVLDDPGGYDRHGLSIAACAAMTRAELSCALTERGCRAAPVLSAREALDSRQTQARGLVFLARDDDGEEWPLLASPLRLKGTPPIVRRPMPDLGRDNAAILAELGQAPPRSARVAASAAS